MQSRYYDPALGRFLNADSYASTGQGFIGYNMFAYCGNNPVNGSDPTGQWIIADFLHKVWRIIEAVYWSVASYALEKNGYCLTANLLNRAAEGDDLQYNAKDGSYAAELCRNDSGIREEIIKNVNDCRPNREGNISASFSYEIPLSNGDLGMALHNVKINVEGSVQGDSLHATVTITDTFDFTEFKNPLSQGSCLKVALWLANDIAYIDSKCGLLDPVSVSISFTEEYMYAVSP